MSEKVRDREIKCLGKKLKRFMGLHKLSEIQTDKVQKKFNTYERSGNVSSLLRPIDVGLAWRANDTPYKKHNTHDDRHSFFQFLSLRWLQYLIIAQPLYKHLYSLDEAIRAYNSIQSYADIRYDLNKMFLTLNKRTWQRRKTSNYKS